MTITPPTKNYIQYSRLVQTSRPTIPPYSLTKEMKEADGVYM